MKGRQFIAENEIAHAGIGVDVGVNGLDNLIKTNSALEKFHNLAEQLHDSVVNITPHIQNDDEVSRFYRDVRQLGKGTDANINVHADTSSLNNIKNNIDRANHGVEHFRNSLTSVGRTSNSSFSNLNRHVDSAKQHTSALADVGHRLHRSYGVFSSFVGNTLSNAFSTITSGAKSAIKSGFKMVQTGNEIRETWEHIGLNKGNANAMVQQMGDISTKSDLDAKSIQNMQRSFYNFTGSAGKARELTNEMAAFGKASGESAQQFTQVSHTLPRVFESSKVNLMSFNRAFGRTPTLVRAMAKADGKSVGGFKKMITGSKVMQRKVLKNGRVTYKQITVGGKVTGQQLEKYMLKASKGSSRAWSQYTHTFGGLMAITRGTWTKAKKTFAQPFTSNLTTAINQATQSTGGLLKVQQVAQKLAHTLGQRVGAYMGKAIGWLVKNQRPLTRIGSSLLKITKIIGQGVWDEFSSILINISGHAHQGTKGLNGVSNSLTAISKHTTALRNVGRALLVYFAIAKLRKIKQTLFGVGKGFGLIGKLAHSVIHPQATLLRLQEAWNTAQKVWIAFIGPVKAFFTALKAGTGIQLALDAALDANPIGAVVAGVTAAVAAVTGLVIGLHHLYVHCTPVRHAMQAIGHVGVMVFKAITLPIRMDIKFISALVGAIWKATSGIRHKLANGFHKVGDAASHAYHRATNTAGEYGRRAGHYVGSEVNKFTGGQRTNLRAVSHAHRSIDRYRQNSSHKFRAYIAKSGKIYRSYHKGTTRISETTYKQREALRNRYYAKYESSLRKYENNYKHYEDKRSSLSRRYGKLRAMYSQRSLQLIEKRFNGLRKTVVKYARDMFHDTQHIFHKLGIGAGKQFLNIYKYVRKYLRMSNREAKSDFRALYQIDRRYLNGSVKRYVNELRYRYKKQHYYDKQLVEQSKATAKSMYRLPLGWIHRETHDLIQNWQRQRKSFITHNVRMSHAELTHFDTMSHHLNKFGDDFKKTMSSLEDDIYDAWRKFWANMHNAAGHGINSVQNPLNGGAMHINSFVRAFGETSSPMHEMPEVSYATGTGARRPITQMVQATLNDGQDSPETNNQETVIHPNGSIEFPQGRNVQETLEPGTEVLNATETKLMGEMAHFAPTVHLATGTGLFGGLFNHLSGWIKSALNGTNNGTDYSTLYNQSKGSGYHKLLHVLQKVLGHSSQVLAGFMGNAPHGFNGALSDITKGIYGQTSNQIDQWWKALMNLTNQTLDDDASSSDILNYAVKNWTHVPYSGGGVAHTGADCGGAVQSILAHFHIPISHTDMEDSPAVKFIGTDESKARPGDLVMFGKKYHAKSGMDSHVGIFEKPGQMWSEHPPYSGQESIKEAAASDGLWGYYRIKNAPNNNNAPSFKGANKGLMAFVRKQESPYFKWIEKHLTPLLDFSDISGTAGAWTKPGTQAHHIAEDVFEAAEHVGLDAKHAAAVVGNAWHESAGFEHGLKVNQFGGGGGKGLFQFTGQGSKYGWSPLGQVKSILANALGSSASSWERSGGSPSSLAHSFETIFERGSIPAFAARDAAAERAYFMFGDNGHAHGGHLKAGELATVGEQGAELFKPDVSGTVIPHSATKRILNNTTNKRPINIQQHNTYQIKGDDPKQIAREIDRHQSISNDNLMAKLNRLGGNDDGGILV